MVSRHLCFCMFIVCMFVRQCFVFSFRLCVCLQVCPLAYLSLCRFVFLSLFNGNGNWYQLGLYALMESLSLLNMNIFTLLCHFYWGTGKYKIYLFFNRKKKQRKQKQIFTYNSPDGGVWYVEVAGFGGNLRWVLGSGLAGPSCSVESGGSVVLLVTQTHGGHHGSRVQARKHHGLGGHGLQVSLVGRTQLAGDLNICKLILVHL